MYYSNIILCYCGIQHACTYKHYTGTSINKRLINCYIIMVVMNHAVYTAEKHRLHGYIKSHKSKTYSATHSLHIYNTDQFYIASEHNHPNSVPLGVEVTLMISHNVVHHGFPKQLKPCHCYTSTPPSRPSHENFRYTKNKHTMQQNSTNAVDWRPFCVSLSSIGRYFTPQSFYLEASYCHDHAEA